MKIDAGLDTGAMLLKWETEIGEEETAIELGARLARAGADLLVQTLADLPTISPETQDNAQATLAPILKNEDGHIDWTAGAGNFESGSRISALAGMLRIFERAAVCTSGGGAMADRQLAPGRMQREENACSPDAAEGRIELLEVQLEGKKRMAASAFLNGFSIEADEVLAMNLPLGFRYSAIFAGIRKVIKDDLALIVSDTRATAAAVFTQNRVVAAPVEIARKNLRGVARTDARDSGQRGQRELRDAGPANKSRSKRRARRPRRSARKPKRCCRRRLE